ncbi:MAG: DUF371 domain-containing protein [Candidatus Hodarchaeaceae archaeon]|nr:DUF371 domain-containing protein [Candidatus Hodarchaeaceae archaeon]
MSWVVVARGHPGVTARHRTTFMVTKDREVSPRGDCIIAVGADKAVSDLPPELKRAIKAGRELSITLKVGKTVEKIQARGHPSLALDHPTDIVVRKSKFTCGRTLAIRADKAAADLQRKFVTALRNPATKLEMRVEIGA